MALNFRLAARQGTGYTDLFPRLASIDNVIDANSAFKKETINVTIPATSDNTQTITITTTPEQVAAPVNMYMTSTGEQAQADYATINQFSVTDNTLTIIRVYTMPTGSIDVTLEFLVKRGEVTYNAKSSF